MKSPLIAAVPSYLEGLIQPLEPKRTLDPYEDAHSETDISILGAIERDIYLAYKARYEYQTILTWTEMCLPNWKGKSRVDLEQFYSHRAAATYAFVLRLDFTSYTELEDRMEGLKHEWFSWLSSAANNINALNLSMGYKQDVLYLAQQGGLRAFKDLLIFDESGDLRYQLPYDEHSDPNDMTWGRLEKVLGNEAARKEFRDSEVYEI